MQAKFDTTTSEGKTAAIESYRAAISSEPELSFKEFCNRSGIENYDSLLWWCNRHHISVQSIQREAGKNQLDSSSSPTFIQFRPRPHSQSSTLKNISITFTDGVNLSLQESGVEDLVSLLTLYQSRKQAEGGASVCSL